MMLRCDMGAGSKRASVMAMASWFAMCGTAPSATTASTTGQTTRRTCFCRNTVPDAVL